KWCISRPSADQRVEDGGFVGRLGGLAGRTGRGVATLVDGVVWYLQRALHAAASKAQHCEREQRRRRGNLPKSALLSRSNLHHSRHRQRLSPNLGQRF